MLKTLKNICNSLSPFRGSGGWSLGLILLLALSFQNVYAEDHTPDYYDSAVRTHFKHQRWEVGKRILDKGMKYYGTLSVMNELQGWYYYHHKQYTKARYFLFKSLKDNSENQHSRELLVKVEEETKNYSAAICYINEILETNPYDIGWWRRKINLFRKQGNHIEADRLLHRLKQIYPKDTQVQKDIDYQTEMVYAAQKKKGDPEGMLQSLRALVRSNPKNADNYMQLTNLLLQLGQIDNALSTAAQGARTTGSAALAKKYAGILADQGKYTEAIAYLKEMQRSVHIGGLESTIKYMEELMAQASLSNDPYIVYGKIYEKKKDGDALNFLLNTSMARGYDDDALYYISEMRKKTGNTFKLAYMEYSIYKRTGNTRAANRMLEKLATMNPDDEEISEEVAANHLEKANSAMQAEAYDDAIPELLLAQSRTKDTEVRKSCAIRLFNCYLQIKDYDQATQQLDSIKSVFTNTRYTLSKVDILKHQGKYYEALNTLRQAYLDTDDLDEQASYSDSYEELVYPKIKEMIEQKLMQPANKLAMSAIEVCPNSQLLFHQAITTSSVLKKTDEQRELIAKARERFPDDPYFIVKEAGLYADDEDYEKARNMIRPLLDIYIGDTAIIRAYVSNCEAAALKYMKEKKNTEAIAACNDGLSFYGDNRSLLYTKGLVFENMKQYDSAYYYQRKYIPSIMEIREFKSHLEMLCAKQFKNSILVDYNHSVNGENNKRTGLANVTYSRKGKRNNYDYQVSYIGRDGAEDREDDEETQEPGGTGVQGGFGWSHRVNDHVGWTASAAAATKYFPVVKLAAALDLTDVKLGKKFNFNLQLNVTARWIRTYNKLFRSVYDPDHVPDENKGETIDDKYVSKFCGWKENKDFLFSAGGVWTKEVEKFGMQVGANAYLMSKHAFYSVNAKGSFKPFDFNASNVYVMGGFGSAPEASLIDKSMPGSFDHTNTYIGMGLLYMYNRHITLGLSGTWYTLYSTNQVLKNADVYYSMPKRYFLVENVTRYSNYFYTNVQLLINF